MAKRLCGRRWLEFTLFGLQWQVRWAAQNSKVLDHGKTMGLCLYEERVIYISAGISSEQMRTTLAHEIQHLIEDHADVDHSHAATGEVSDRWTDQLSRGWLYLIRGCPELVAIFQAKD